MRVIGRARSWQRKLKSSIRWASYMAGQTSRLPYPDRMYIESTNFCNLNCIMCPSGRQEMRRKKGFIEFDLFKRIVDEMAPHVQVTTLHIWGEPLLHPRIFDMIAYSRKAGIRSEISTNATLLDEEKSEQLLAAGAGGIYLCLDGVRKETYEAIRRRADFESTRANIQGFLRKKVEAGLKEPYVNLQIIEMQPTVDEVDQFKRMWSVQGVDNVNVKAFDSWANQIDAINGLRPDEPDVPTTRCPCPNLWYHVHIYWDGTLVCCDRDFDALYPLGNVSDGVMKAWNGPTMVELRRKHVCNQLEDVPSCRGCVEWSWWRPSVFQSHGNSPMQKTGASKKATA